MPYDKKKTEGGIDFVVFPEDAPTSGGLIAIAILFGVMGFGLFALGGLGILLGVPMLLGALLFIIAANRDSRPKGHKQSYRFSVADGSLMIDGITIHGDDIHRITVCHGNEISRSTVLGTAAVGVALGHGAMIGGLGAAAIATRLDAIAFSTQIEASGKAYTLGAGLDEVGANGLMVDVARSLGLDVGTALVG